jgi:hypothetical protein
MIGSLGKLAVSLYIYVLHPRASTNLRVRKFAYLKGYTAFRNYPSLSDYCAEMHCALLRKLGGEGLKQMLGPEIGIG